MVCIRFLSLADWTVAVIEMRDHRVEPWVHLDQYAVSIQEGLWWRLVIRGTANVGASTWTAWESLGECMDASHDRWNKMREQASTRIREIKERLEGHGLIVLPGIWDREGGCNV